MATGCTSMRGHGIIDRFAHSDRSGGAKLSTTMVRGFLATMQQAVAVTTVTRQVSEWCRCGSCVI
eukprot:4511694-Pleurochrysis_carterae.AAC.1